MALRKQVPQLSDMFMGDLRKLASDGEPIHIGDFYPEEFPALEEMVRVDGVAVDVIDEELR